jgi:triosephosphate isomerase
MRQIFVNLKRFDVPRSKGGLCPLEDPLVWIEGVINKSVELGLGEQPGLTLTYLLPEGLIAIAARKLANFPPDRTHRLAVGCQGVHWEDIQPGKNFGAYTASLPANAAVNLGSRWAIIGHSEERKAKLQVIQTFEPALEADPRQRTRASRAVDQLIQSEVSCALSAGLNVLLCVGESAEERGEGAFEEQKVRIEAVLRDQILADLRPAVQSLQEHRVVIGYEPIWAIGPGRVPPGKEYISYVSALIKNIVQENFTAPVAVVYGGGLKEENAAMIASIETIDGGLVALTRFTGEIGFDVPGLKGIVDKYLDL